MSELSGTAVKTKRTKSHSEIEKILAETGALHLKQLYEKLNERGIPMSYQGLSGLMQLYAKAGKKFVKVAPATFALIEQDAFNEPEPTVNPEVSVDPNDNNKPNTSAKKKASTKPNANVQTVNSANASNEAETASAEKRTIVYEMDENETNEGETGGNDEQ